MAGQRNSYGKRRFDYSDAGGGGGGKRHYSDEDRAQSSEDSTVYRYLCPGRKIGSILGRGGEIAKQLRSDTGARINIGETVNNCEERVVTIVSSNKESNAPVEVGETVSAAQDALIRVHEKIVADDLGGGGDGGGEGGEEGEAVADPSQITARLLVPSDQIGCVIGKGGTIIQGIRIDTGAQIRIMKDNHLPACALPGDELLQIVGDAPTVNKALTAVASRLHSNPSHSSKALAQVRGRGHSGRDTWQEPPPYGGYSRDRDYPVYIPPPRDEYSAREFSLKIVCNSLLIGGVIGKGGGIINQIRQDSRASIKVETEPVEEDCVIIVSAREHFEDVVSPTIDAAVRLQPRCSEKNDPDAPNAIFTTRLLVPSSRIGCLLGKGGSIITEMRKMTCAGIKIVSKDKMPKVAAVEDEMVQISGELDVARQALIQVATRLKANFFERERDLGGFMPPLPYEPPLRRSVSPEPSRYSGRDGGGRYGGGYGSGGGEMDYGSSSRYAPQTGGSSYGGHGGSYSRRSGSNGR
ncbi:hypothetical protein LUZ60_005795 [Juncus effusus]|nr:hypothetical protein LUZ60_005795 [Juncus effusus]